MKGYNRWNYKPYIPFIRLNETKSPYICRLAPGKGSIEMEWLYDEYQGDLFYTKVGSEDWMKKQISANRFMLDQLEDETDYQFYIQAKDGAKSKIRLARTGFAPGVVVNYLHPKDDYYGFSGRYLCSPSIIKLPSGKLIASMDLFDRQAPQNLTLLFSSLDNGKTWSYLCELFPCFWGKLFWHRGSLYMLSTSTEYGDLLIGRSDDEGQTWSMPTVIMRGACNCRENGFHRAPTVIINHDGRLWTAVEYGSWSKREYTNSLVSIDEQDDLLQAENWTVTLPLHHQQEWENALGVVGGIEGNVVISPNGELLNILRYAENKALILKGDLKYFDKPFEFHKVIDFPMGHSKFEIQKKNEKYYAVGNQLPKRNILSLYCSSDLEHWEFVLDIINYESLDMEKTGFQYPSFYMDGDELLVLSRTAFNSAQNFHDSNLMTFHQIKYR